MMGFSPAQLFAAEAGEKILPQISGDERR